MRDFLINLIENRGYSIFELVDESVDMEMTFNDLITFILLNPERAEKIRNNLIEIDSLNQDTFSYLVSLL